jgi:aspartate-semialdehyde dehydrogenase
MKKYKIAVVGATGNVGSEVLSILSSRKFPIEKIYALASGVSAGKNISFGKEILTVEDVNRFDFSSVDIAIFATDGGISREFRAKVFESGCIMIDNSAAFRMENGVPLVLPDVNPEALKLYKEKRIISNPNCTTSQMAVFLKPLHDKYKVKRVVASTYQSVSGAGKSAMDELYAQTKSFFEVAMMGKEVTPRTKVNIFTKDMAFNCIPHIDQFMEDGRTKEEWKMEVETQKIFSSDIRVSATCVRVPVFVGHAISLNVELQNSFEFEELIEELNDFEGLVVQDRREDGGYATHKEVVRTFGVYASRIRADKTCPNSINAWIVADNVYGIGAAYNNVRIAEELIKIL